MNGFVYSYFRTKLSMRYGQNSQQSLRVRFYKVVNYFGSACKPGSTLGPSECETSGSITARGLGKKTQLRRFFSYSSKSYLT